MREFFLIVFAGNFCCVRQNGRERGMSFLLLQVRLDFDKVRDTTALINQLEKD